VLSACAQGCDGYVDVGKAKTNNGDGDDTSGDGDGVMGDGDGVMGDGDGVAGEGGGPSALSCEDEDALVRADYDEWKATDNDFGDLVGQTFSGYIEGDADVALIIDEDGNARFVVDEAAPAPTERESGYLCDDSKFESCRSAAERQPVIGGTYEIHGATFDGNRLRVPLPQFAPYDQWCALQNPVAWHDDPCYFDLTDGGPITWGEQGCSVNVKDVNCGWFDLAVQALVCRCTSSECFASAVSIQGGQLEIDARVSDDGFVGSFLGAENRTIYLFTEN
jgi:hypothetical protein